MRSFEKLVRFYKRLPFLPEHDVVVGFKAIGQKMAELFEDELIELRYLHGVHGQWQSWRISAIPSSF